MTAPGTDGLTGEQREMREILDDLGPAGACCMIERGILSALRGHDIPAVPSLLLLMCRYDPGRAELLRLAMIAATEQTS